MTAADRARELADTWHPSQPFTQAMRAREVLVALVTENEALQAANDKLNYEIMAYQVGDPYQLGHEHGQQASMQSVQRLMEERNQLRAEQAEEEALVARLTTSLQALSTAISGSRPPVPKDNNLQAFEKIAVWLCGVTAPLEAAKALLAEIGETQP